MITPTVVPPATRVVSGPGAVAAALEALASLQSEVDVPLYSSARWVSTFAEIHGAESALAVVVDGAESADGLALLSVQSGRVPRVVPFGTPLVDLTVFPHRDGAAARLARGMTAALASLGRRWRLDIGQLPEGDAVAAALTGVLDVVEVTAGTGVPFTRFGAERDVGAYLSSKIRSDVRRMMRRMQDAHEVEISVVTDPAEVAGVAREAIDLRRRRDEHLDRPSGLEHEPQRRFFTDLVRSYARAGRGEIRVLRLDGAMAGYLVGLTEGSVYTAWDQRIDDAFAAFSPGKVLYTHAVEDVLARPEVVAIDFGRGVQEAKLRFATDVVATRALRAWSAPGLRRMDDAFVSAADRARRLKDDHPALQRTWRRLRHLRERLDRD